MIIVVIPYAEIKANKNSLIFRSFIVTLSSNKRNVSQTQDESNKVFFIIDIGNAAFGCMFSRER